MIYQFFAISAMALGIAVVGAEIVMGGHTVAMKLLGVVAILGAAYGVAYAGRALMGV